MNLKDSTARVQTMLWHWSKFKMCIILYFLHSSGRGVRLEVHGAPSVNIIQFIFHRRSYAVIYRFLHISSILLHLTESLSCHDHIWQKNEEEKREGKKVVRNSWGKVGVRYNMHCRIQLQLSNSIDPINTRAVIVGCNSIMFPIYCCNLSEFTRCGNK